MHVALVILLSLGAVLLGAAQLGLGPGLLLVARRHAPARQRRGAVNRVALRFLGAWIAFSVVVGVVGAWLSRSLFIGVVAGCLAFAASIFVLLVIVGIRGDLG